MLRWGTKRPLEKTDKTKVPHLDDERYTPLAGRPDCFAGHFTGQNYSRLG
jgi:hypothetical protein